MILLSEYYISPDAKNSAGFCGVQFEGSSLLSSNAFDDDEDWKLLVNFETASHDVDDDTLSFSSNGYEPLQLSDSAEKFLSLINRAKTRIESIESLTLMDFCVLSLFHFGY